MRKPAVACGSEAAARGNVGGELRGIGEIEGGILGKSDQGFRGGGECAAEHRLVDEVHAEARSVAAGGVGHVVAELVFLLVAQHGKGGDGGDELIVTECFAAGNGAGCGAEGKRERETEVGIAGSR